MTSLVLRRGRPYTENQGQLVFWCDDAPASRMECGATQQRSINPSQVDLCCRSRRLLKPCLSSCVAWSTSPSSAVHRTDRTGRLRHPRDQHICIQAQPIPAINSSLIYGPKCDGQVDILPAETCPTGQHPVSKHAGHSDISPTASYKRTHRPAGLTSQHPRSSAQRPQPQNSGPEHSEQCTTPAAATCTHVRGQPPIRIEDTTCGRTTKVNPPTGHHRPARAEELPALRTAHAPSWASLTSGRPPGS